MSRCSHDVHVTDSFPGRLIGNWFPCLILTDFIKHHCPISQMGTLRPRATQPSCRTELWSRWASLENPRSFLRCLLSHFVEEIIQQHKWLWNSIRSTKLSSACTEDGQGLQGQHPVLPPIARKDFMNLETGLRRRVLWGRGDRDRIYRNNIVSILK